MSRRHTNAEIRAGIDALESRGWSINADGTITRTQMQAKKITHDPRTNAEPRHTFCRGKKSYSIKASDLMAAKFGLVAAKEQPDAEGVDLRSTLSPETQPVAAQRGPCGHCGGFMTHIKYVGEPDERKCVQCGRTGMPPRVLSAEELKSLRRNVRIRAASPGGHTASGGGWASPAPPSTPSCVAPDSASLRA